MNPESRLPQRLALLSLLLLGLSALAFALPSLAAMLPERPVERTAVVVITPTAPAIATLASVTPAPTVAPTTAPQLVVDTPTPTATAVPTPAFTDEETQYGVAMIANMDDYTAAMDLLTTNFGLLSDNPNLLFDEDWRFETGFTLGGLRVVNERIRNLTPPPRFAGPHATMVASGRELDMAIANMLLGLDTLNADAITTSANALDRSVVLMQQANAELQAMAQE